MAAYGCENEKDEKQVRDIERALQQKWEKDYEEQLDSEYRGQYDDENELEDDERHLEALCSKMQYYHGRDV